MITKDDYLKYDLADRLKDNGIILLKNPRACWYVVKNKIDKLPDNRDIELSIVCGLNLVRERTGLLVHNECLDIEKSVPTYSSSQLEEAYKRLPFQIEIRGGERYHKELFANYDGLYTARYVDDESIENVDSVIYYVGDYKSVIAELILGFADLVRNEEIRFKFREAFPMDM